VVVTATRTDQRAFDLPVSDKLHFKASAIYYRTDGQVDLSEAPRFPDARQAAKPGSLESPLPGRVIRVFVEAGATVELGQPLLIVEAMKMEHEIVAPAAGPVVELRVSEGQQVETGTVLAVIGDGDGDGAVR